MVAMVVVLLVSLVFLVLLVFWRDIGVVCWQIKIRSEAEVHSRCRVQRLLKSQRHFSATRYAGLYWTNSTKWDKLDTTGIETVRYSSRQNV